MQESIEKEIEGAIQHAQLQPLISRAFVNTGTIYGQSVVGHRTIVEIGFNFQSDHAKFSLNGTMHYFDYNESERIEAFFKALRALLDASRNGKTK